MATPANLLWVPIGNATLHLRAGVLLKEMGGTFYRKSWRVSLTDLPLSLPEEWGKISMRKTPFRDELQTLEMEIFLNEECWPAILLDK